MEKADLLSRRGWVRLAAAALAVAGLFFALYPAIRPFSDETSLQGATAFASDAWIVAHVSAMLGFVLVTLGLLGVRLELDRTPGAGIASLALVVTWLGVGLTLPFYGAEAFGLHAIGQEALRQNSLTVYALANEVRTGPGLVVFLVGLTLLAVGGVTAAVAVWRSGSLPKWSGIPLALDFALYIPQFFGSQPLRVGHGVLVAAGCVWLAVVLFNSRMPAHVASSQDQ